MLEVTAIEDAHAATASLDPIRSRLLAELAIPNSATALGHRLGIPRQKVNYHLRLLEQHGLIELVEERKKGNVMERVMRATAASYVITPAALAPVQPDPARSPDRMSASWMLALAAKLVKDVGQLLTASARESKPLATFALDGEIRFATAADRAAFAEELSNATMTLVSRYHDESAVRGRDYRLVLAIHPSTTPPAPALEKSDHGA
jgi:DNA-binding transcriptional ArsR family regulator